MKTKSNAPKSNAPKTGSSTNSAPTELAVVQKPLWDSAYVELERRLRPELDAVPASKVRTPNVDIQRAVNTALGVLPVLDLLRPQVVALGAAADMHAYDNVGAYAHVLQYAHGEFLAAEVPSDGLTLEHEEALALRDTLADGAQGHVSKGVFSRAFIAQVRGGQGHNNTITTIMQLTSAIRAAWPSICANTSIDPADVDAADAAAKRLADAIGARDKRAATLTKRANDRQLAFTLFYGAYNEVRRIVTFLRWNEGDVDELVPSLYAKAGGTRYKEEAGEDPQPEGGATPAKPEGSVEKTEPK